MPSQAWIFIGCVSAFISVVAGAFGAHGLNQILDFYSIEVFKTAAHYHLIHSLALVAYGIFLEQRTVVKKKYPLAGFAFALGILLFSGSLYALALTGMKFLGAITPFGGLLFMAGWIAFAIESYPKPKPPPVL